MRNIAVSFFQKEPRNCGPGGCGESKSCAEQNDTNARARLPQGQEQPRGNHASILFQMSFPNDSWHISIRAIDVVVPATLAKHSIAKTT
jgi:hypothetical protein